MISTVMLKSDMNWFDENFTLFQDSVHLNVQFIISRTQIPRVEKQKIAIFFKIVTNFMNFFSTTDQTQYAFIYQNQDSFKKKRKNFDCVFDSKVIIDFFFKIRLQITAKNEFDFKKKKIKKKNLNLNLN